MRTILRTALGAAIAATTLAGLLAAGPIGHARADATQGDAGADAGEGHTYGCVESVPKGATRPLVNDSFPTHGTSGWAATLVVTVKHGKGERVLPSGLSLSTAVEATKVLKDAGFGIPDQDGGAGATVTTEPEDPAKSLVTTRFELPLVLLPPNVGRQTLRLPPLPIAIARANGEIASICTRTHLIVVEDPIANTPQPEPKLNPPPIPQREEWTSLKRAVGWGSLGLVVGGLIAWLLYKRLSRPKPPPPPPPPRPAWDVAFEKLDEVRHAGLLDIQRYGEYYDRVSDAVRGYLGARFGFDGLESTTDEILASLRAQGGGFVRLEPELDVPNLPGLTIRPLPGIPLTEIARFLRECDLVKFANLTPSPEQCSQALTMGERIVRETMPSPSSVPVAVPVPVPATPSASSSSPPPAPASRSPYEPPEEPPQPHEETPSPAAKDDDPKEPSS